MNPHTEAHDVAGAHQDVRERIEAIMAAAHTDTEIPPKPDPRIWKAYKEENLKLDARLGRGEL